VVDTSVAPVGFRGQEGDDEVQSNAGISMVWSPFQIASSREREDRLEMQAPRRASLT
jgi:hypothetical protein